MYNNNTNNNYNINMNNNMNMDDPIFLDPPFSASTRPPADLPEPGVPYYIRSVLSGLYLLPQGPLPLPLLSQAPLLIGNPYQQWVITARPNGAIIQNLGEAQPVSGVITSSLIDPDLFVVGFNDLVTQFWLFGATPVNGQYALANLRGDVIRLMTTPDPSTGNNALFIVDYTSGPFLESQLFVFERA